MRNKESGQVTVIAALCMIAFLGVAAFCINGSYAYFQQAQMQAQVDWQTKYGARDITNGSCSGSPLPGMNLQSPPSNGPYAGKSNYCEGSYQKDPGGFFGTILKFPLHLSVHAVAVGGTSSVPRDYPAIIGLNPNGCSLWLNSGSATVKLGSADVGLNSFTNGSPCVNNGATISPNANTITVDNCPTVSCFTDPFGPLGTVPSSSGLPLTVKCGGTSKGCPADDYNDFSWIDTTMGTGCLALYKGKYGLPNSPSGQSIYEFPRSASAVYNGVVTGNSSDKNYYFMPYCTTGVSAPGMYYFGSGLSLSGQTALNTRDSTLIFAPGVNFSNTGKTTWNLDGPDSGLFYDKPFKEGIVLYQPTNSACPADTFSFNGSVTISENGIVDLPCALVNISGDSVTGFGDMTVWELEVSGNGSLNLAPPSKDDQEWLARGALLVQ